MSTDTEFRAAINQYIQENYVDAYKIFFALANEKNVAEAKYYLGLMYENGDGVEKNSDEAAKWFSAFLRQLRDAAEAGDSLSQFRLGKLYQFGDKVLKNEKEAIKWFTAAAEQGYAEAQFHLSRLYLYGWCGVVKDDELEEFWFQKSVKQKFPEALYSLAVRILNSSDKKDNAALQHVKGLLQQAENAGIREASDVLAQLAGVKGVKGDGKE